MDEAGVNHSTDCFSTPSHAGSTVSILWLVGSYIPEPLSLHMTPCGGATDVECTFTGASYIGSALTRIGLVGLRTTFRTAFFTGFLAYYLLIASLLALALRSASLLRANVSTNLLSDAFLSFSSLIFLSLSSYLLACAASLISAASLACSRAALSAARWAAAALSAASCASKARLSASRSACAW